MSEQYDQFLDLAQEVQNSVRQAKISIQKGVNGIPQAKNITTQARQTFVNASSYISKLKGQEYTNSQSALRKLNTELQELEQLVNAQTVSQPKYGQNKNLAEANMYLNDTDQMMDEANTIATDVVNVLGQQNQQMRGISGTTTNIVQNTGQANKLVSHMKKVEKLVNITLWSISGALILVDALGFYIFHHNKK
ncbi:SNARE protein [Spironucleus salmonicida]|uniref:SNARE protein n=1 Tax=Spironucleus salmonicida TaxID=348837 RepID=V6LCS8_9EUKA|nr:SNARE protein [Spironucleus salmonicida]|eukprot:EST42058.1 hypothetical protein SS50377_18365 [Spironucleus salmonicida]